MGTWHTPATVREVWRDAKEISDAALNDLLEEAKGLILGELRIDPASEPAEDAVPANWRNVQAAEARALWLVTKVNAGGDGDYGMDGLQVSRPTYVMSRASQIRLRPERDWIA